MKLMLVEDEYLLNKAIKTYLESKSFLVDGFTDGLEALESINNSYNLFILDIDIPQVSGIELLREIRKIYHSIPIIIISATIDIEMISKAYTLGCNDYLKKPFDIRELELKINALTRSISSKMIIKDTLVYDKELDILELDNQQIILSAKEKRFILVLLENRGSVVTHEHLESSIWDTLKDKPHLRQFVSRLNKKLPYKVILNRVNEGYIIL